MIKKISVLLSCLLFLLTFAACAAATGPEEQEFYKLAGFESLEELRSMNYLNSFKASLNSDETYVTEGEHSIKLEIHGNDIESSCMYPTFWVYTANPYNALNKTDFTDVDYFAFDIYNASDRELEMSFGYSYEVNESAPHSPRSQLTLARGWNHITMPLIREAAVQGFDISKIDTFMFMFDNPAEGETIPVVYIDRFMAHIAEEPMPAYSAGRAENEICSFDDLADVQCMYSSGIYIFYEGNAMLDLNTDRRYVSQGSGSLRVVNKPFPEYQGSNASPVIGFRGEFMNDIRDFSKYSAVKFNIFNDSGRDYMWAFYVFDNQGAAYVQYTTVKSGVWTEVVAPMEDIARGTGVVNGETVQMDLTNIVEIKWAYRGTSEGEDLVFYLDDLVFQPKGAEA